MNLGFNKIRVLDCARGIINVTNCSSDNGFGEAKPCIRSTCMIPLGVASCVAEASHSSTNGFNLRFVSRVACAPRSSTSGCESTTCVAHDSVSYFCTNPKQAVGNRRGSANSEEFLLCLLIGIVCVFRRSLRQTKSLRRS